MRSIKELDVECARPDDFDLATHWAEASGEFLGSWPTSPVLVRLRAERAAEMVERYTSVPA